MPPANANMSRANTTTHMRYGVKENIVLRIRQDLKYEINYYLCDFVFSSQIVNEVDNLATYSL